VQSQRWAPVQAPPASLPCSNACDSLSHGVQEVLPALAPAKAALETVVSVGPQDWGAAAHTHHAQCAPRTLGPQNPSAPAPASLAPAPRPLPPPEGAAPQKSWGRTTPCRRRRFPLWACSAWRTVAILPSSALPTSPLLPRRTSEPRSSPSLPSLPSRPSFSLSLSRSLSLPSLPFPPFWPSSLPLQCQPHLPPWLHPLSLSSPPPPATELDTSSPSAPSSEIIPPGLRQEAGPKHRGRKDCLELLGVRASIPGLGWLCQLRSSAQRCAPPRCAPSSTGSAWQLEPRGLCRPLPPPRPRCPPLPHRPAPLRTAHQGPPTHGAPPVALPLGTARQLAQRPRQLARGQ